MIDKDKASLAIIGKLSPKPKKDEDEEEVEDESGLDVAVEDMMKALEDKDKSAFKMALKSFIDMSGE